MSANDEEEILVGELERQQKKRRCESSHLIICFLSMAGFNGSFMLAGTIFLGTLSSSSSFQGLQPVARPSHSLGCFKHSRLPISPRAAVLSLRRESILWRRLFEDKDGDFSGSKALCRDLELSFRKVWLRLYTSGADENYSMALKEFVKATVMAFDRGYSIQALIFELGRHEMETGDPNIDKTIRLTEQERDVREVWLTLIYLTLHRLQ
mmetsp:Transcript_40496/g.127531  ORF Transcript_40496/g.127531 Transcript_40496/m.127531 type:complete len:209 (+) Transcript_40496:136-762(+)